MHKILLVEDEKTLGTLLQYRLKDKGYEVLFAENGLEAKEQLQTFSPDIIVCDIMMPFMNGIELLEYVRHELKSKIPFMIFSSYGQEKMVLNAFEIGADDFITKPFSPEELIVRIGKLLKSKKP